VLAICKRVSYHVASVVFSSGADARQRWGRCKGGVCINNKRFYLPTYWIDLRIVKTAGFDARQVRGD